MAKGKVTVSVEGNTTKALREYDAKWANTRSRLEGWLTGCVAGNVVKVKGTAVAG